MLHTILYQMVSLGVAMVINILLGLYYNINIQNIKFDPKVFFIGIVKAAILAASFIGLAYVFNTTDLSSIGITPEMIMNAALIIYVTKDLQNLMKIMGVEIPTTK